MDPSSVRQALREEVLDFCWAQWVQMGVFGTATREDTWSIDPETIIYFTRAVAEEDSRLAELAADWIERNEKLINRRRLDYLGKSLKSIDALPGDLPGPAPDNPRGFPRGTLSAEPNLAAPANLAFRLRQLLGNGSRAEIIRILLGLPYRVSLTVRQIADHAAYSKRNTQEALNSLAAAKAVQSEKRGVRMEAYYLDRQRWADLLGIELSALPHTVFWPALLRVTLAADRYLARIEKLENESPYLSASLAGDFFAENDRDISTIGLPRPAGATVDDFPLLFAHILEELRSILRGRPARPGLGGAL